MIKQLSYRNFLNRLLRASSQARNVLNNCSHLVVYEKDILVETCDGSQRFCLICGIDETEDCHKARFKFSELRKPKILIKGKSFSQVRIKSVGDLVGRLERSLRKSTKERVAFIEEVVIPRKSFFFFAGLESASVLFRSQEAEIFCEVNGKDKGRLNNKLISQILKDIRRVAE